MIFQKQQLTIFVHHWKELSCSTTHSKIMLLSCHVYNPVRTANALQILKHLAVRTSICKGRYIDFKRQHLIEQHLFYKFKEIILTRKRVNCLSHQNYIITRSWSLWATIWILFFAMCAKKKLMDLTPVTSKETHFLPYITIAFAGNFRRSLFR